MDGEGRGSQSTILNGIEHPFRHECNDLPKLSFFCLVMIFKTSGTSLPGQQSFLSTEADSWTCPLEKAPTSLFTEPEEAPCKTTTSSDTRSVFFSHLTHPPTIAEPQCGKDCDTKLSSFCSVVGMRQLLEIFASST